MTASVVSRLMPRLTALAARLDELDRLLADPEVVQNPGRLKDLMRERGALHRKVSVFKAWTAADAAVKEAEAGGAAEADPEMKALFAAEAEDQARKREAAEQKLVDLFLVEDDDSGRNVILEVRAGTGGDEAALWA